MVKLNPADFAYVVKDKRLKEKGLFRGDIVFLMGSKVVPATVRDPYLQRELFVVAKVVEGVPVIPDKEGDDNAFLVDPRSLQLVEKEVSDALIENVQKLYG